MFHEEEPNDFAFEANHFGTLHPGDRFFIDGHITDSGFDPFDGFAFTAASPIHVEFRLFADNPVADLDLCVYDPQLGTDVACYFTSDNPEIGSVDVFASGFDFHLVVESFVGSSTYSLEVDVFALHFNTAEETPEGGTIDSATASAASIVAAGTSAEEVGGKQSDGSAFRSYFERPQDDDDEPEIVARYTLIEVDAESGEVIRTSFALTTNGTWMGIRVRED